MWNHSARLAFNVFNNEYKNIGKPLINQSNSAESYGLSNKHLSDVYPSEFLNSLPQTQLQKPDLQKIDHKAMLMPQVYSRSTQNKQSAFLQNFQEASKRGPMFLKAKQSNTPKNSKKRSALSSFKKESFETSVWEANSPTEDKVVSHSIESINGMAISVFDGHGGPGMSEYAARMLPEFLEFRIEKLLGSDSDQSLENIIKEATTWAYQQIEEKFYQILQCQFRAGNKDIMRLGTCGITVVLYGNKVVVANAGDSQAIILTQKEPQGKLEYLELNERLSVSLASERKRLQAQFTDRDPSILKKNQHNQLYLKGLLQPTKTLGDFYLKKQKYYKKLGPDFQKFDGPYLSCAPVFSVFTVDDTFKHIIIASDGLWDFVSKKQIVSRFSNLESQTDASENENNKEQEVDLTKTYIESPQKVAQSKADILRKMVLEKCAHRKNMSYDQLLNIDPTTRRSYCDDITIAMLSFDASPEHRAMGVITKSMEQV